MSGSTLGQTADMSGDGSYDSEQRFPILLSGLPNLQSTNTFGLKSGERCWNTHSVEEAISNIYSSCTGWSSVRRVAVRTARLSI